MNFRYIYLLFLTAILPMASCKNQKSTEDVRIVLLHHSTGKMIWDGNASTLISKAVGKLSPGLSYSFYGPTSLPGLFKKYNSEFKTRYSVEELVFPKKSPYGWNNYPYDYYKIWVKNAGNTPYMDEPTLEMLTKEYDVIVFKHCFPVSNIQESTDSGSVDSELKTIENYKLQYLALRDKILQFPDTKFILFTGAAQVKSQIPEDEAERAKKFFEWVVSEWDRPDDNIYIWDLYNLETEGGLYFKDDYAYSSDNSHPGASFSAKAAGLLFNRIIDIVTTDGTRTSVTGKSE